MSLNRCRFCERDNPADSKFCNVCGGALHLVPCPSCGAVNDVTMAACYKCRAKLQGSRTDAGDYVSPAAEVPGPLPRENSRIIFGAVLLAAVAVLGFYSYHQGSLIDVSPPPPASSETNSRGGSAEAGDSTPAKADDSVRPTSPAISPPETPNVAPAPAATDQPRAGRRPVESRETKSAAGSIARSRATDPGKSDSREPRRPAACTEAIAALGLCATNPTAVPSARPQTTDSGKAGGQEPPRLEACTEAVAALGLCTPGSSTQRRE